MTGRLYFDWNATAPLRDEARTVVLGALAVTGIWAALFPSLRKEV